MTLLCSLVVLLCLPVFTAATVSGPRERRIAGSIVGDQARRPEHRQRGNEETRRLDRYGTDAKTTSATHLQLRRRRRRRRRLEEHPQDRIIRGKTADRGEFPFFVQGSGCGGALVWHDIVLTAGHCERAFKEWAIVGAYKYASSSYAAELIPTRKSVVHPAFPRTNTMDFMLVLLDRPSQKQLLKLNGNPNYPAGNPKAELVVVGMGRTVSGRNPEYLQKARVDYVTDQQCYGYHHFESDSMICATQDRSATCFGDSGGPLLDKKNRLVGITSWGPESCLHKRDPAVYSKVSAAAAWIRKHICKLSNDPPLYCTNKSKERKKKNEVNNTRTKNTKKKPASKNSSNNNGAKKTKTKTNSVVGGASAKQNTEKEDTNGDLDKKKSKNGDDSAGQEEKETVEIRTAYKGLEKKKPKRKKKKNTNDDGAANQEKAAISTEASATNMGLDKKGATKRTEKKRKRRRERRQGRIKT